MAKNDIPVKAGETKPRRKQGSWLPNVEQPNTEAGDNAKLIQLNLELASLPAVDLNDYEQASGAIRSYFEIYAKYDYKPTVAGLGIALGLDRRRLWEIRHGDYSHLPTRYRNKLSDSTRDLIKKTYDILENLWENYTNSGKINPVSAIFLGKNQFGYQDKVEYTVSPGQTSDSDFDRKAVLERYGTGSDLDPNIIDSDD